MRSAGLRFADVHIPESDLEWSFDTSGGPGGQHANKSSTRVTLTFDLNESAAITRERRTRLIDRLGSRARNGVVTVTVDETRSQWRNRAIARHRLAELLDRASLPERTRRASSPTHASRRRRLEAKRHRSEIKRLRERPRADD
jgi:ribosome-associated protein